MPSRSSIAPGGSAGLFGGSEGPHEVHVAATQYLTLYAMLDAIRRFHRTFPDIRVRLQTRTERDIEDALLRDPDLAFGVAAPYEGGSGLEYRHLFSLDWGLITPPNHPLLRKRGFTLADLVDVPLIVFERGSTGRQHVLNAFHRRGLSPRIDMEATTTGIVVKMVEAGLGVSLVPLMPSARVTRGVQVGVRKLPGVIEPIDSGILIRRGETPPPRPKRSCVSCNRRVELWTSDNAPSRVVQLMRIRSRLTSCL